MPIEANLHRPVSNCGQWRDGFLIVAPGAVDSAAVFMIRIYAQDCRASRADYGFRADVDRHALIQAATDDETGRFAVSATDRGLACDWLFAASEMSGLPDGSYQASICVADGDDRAELVRLNFVVR